MEIEPAGILPGQRTNSGTRKAPSQFVSFSLAEGGHPTVRPAVHVCGPLSVLYMTKVSFGDTQTVQEVLEQLTHIFVVVNHKGLSW